MKTFISLLVLALSGCALMPSAFDSALYDRTVSLATTAKEVHRLCGTPGMQAGVEALNYQSKALMKYTEFTSKGLHEPVAYVDKAIGQMDTIYQKGTPDVAYCNIKMGIIEEEIDLLLTGMGAKQ
jgi:hypothetical protein